MRAYRKGKRGCDSFQEFRPISVMGHGHPKQEESSGLCPWNPHYPFVLVPQRHLSLDKEPLEDWAQGGSGGYWRHRDLCFLSAPAIAGAYGDTRRHMAVPCLVAATAPVSDLIHSRAWNGGSHQAERTQNNLQQEKTFVTLVQGFQAQHLEASCVHRSRSLFCGVWKGGNMQGAEPQSAAPLWTPQNLSNEISTLRSFGLSWDVSQQKSSAFPLWSSGSTEVQSLLGIHLKQPLHRDGPFSHLRTDVKDGPTCQAPRTFLQDGKKLKCCWRTEIYKMGLESLKAAVVTELASSQDREAELLDVHWSSLLTVHVLWINLSALWFTEEQPALASAFEYETQMIRGSSAHAVFSLNFKLTSCLVPATNETGFRVNCFFPGVNTG